MRTGTFVASSLALALISFAGPTSAQVLECILQAAQGTGTATAVCPAGHQFATGGGYFSFSVNGANDASPTHGFVSPSYFVDFPGSTNGFAYASCCNASAGTTEVHSNTNVATASCGSKIAVGGGGFCDDDSAKITFSHPLPYSTGSTPHEWTVRCNKPGVWAAVNCTNDDRYDTCRVKRTVAPSSTTTSAACFDDEVVTSAGAWCATGYVKAMSYAADLSTTTETCSTPDTHAFAVCCEGFVP